jgi:YD repeat-containing protein
LTGDQECATFAGALPGIAANVLEPVMVCMGRLISGVRVFVFGGALPRGYNALANAWAPAPNITYSIVQNGSNWELTQPDDSVLTFNATGELTSIKYRGGYTQTLTWSNGQNTVVSDNLGRSLTFTYGANGRLAEMTDPGGRKIKYT